MPKTDSRIWWCRVSSSFVGNALQVFEDQIILKPVVRAGLSCKHPPIDPKVEAWEKDFILVLSHSGSVPQLVVQMISIMYLDLVIHHCTGFRSLNLIDWLAENHILSFCSSFPYLSSCKDWQACLNWAQSVVAVTCLMSTFPFHPGLKISDIEVKKVKDKSPWKTGITSCQSTLDCLWELDFMRKAGWGLQSINLSQGHV